MATPLEIRAKRIIETPLGSRVMLPKFGSKLYELIDKTVDDEHRLKFISYTFQAFYDVDNGVLWDRELEPQAISVRFEGGVAKANITLVTGKELAL